VATALNNGQRSLRKLLRAIAPPSQSRYAGAGKRRFSESRTAYGRLAVVDRQLVWDVSSR
jgi:hypothetical protein